MSDEWLGNPELVAEIGAYLYVQGWLTATAAKLQRVRMTELDALVQQLKAVLTEARDALDSEGAFNAENVNDPDTLECKITVLLRE